MPRLEVFDPPMCCSTGVCGPGVDPALARFAADLDWLVGQGVEVARFNLAQDPSAFVRNALVAEAMRAKEDALPLVLVDGAIVAEGRYPDRQALARFTGRPAPSGAVAEPEGAGCCCGPAESAPVTLGASPKPKKKCCC